MGCCSVKDMSNDPWFIAAAIMLAVFVISMSFVAISIAFKG